jgi:pyridoxine kinase
LYWRGLSIRVTALVVPLALIVSSFVAASRIGGSAQQYVLAAHRIDPVLAPTVLFGRSPAKGAHGQVTSAEVLSQMLGDIEADAVFGMVDLLLTGHFSSADQVEVAAGLIERIRAAPREAGYAGRPVVVVDPILGDFPKGLYVKPEVAEAIARRLVPNADYITPNVWELASLTGRDIATTEDARNAARELGVPALVTSAPARRGEIGILYVDRDEAVLFAHPKLPSVSNGTGDLVAASFGAGLVEGMIPLAAAERAARAAAEAVKAAQIWRSPELPIVALAGRLANPTEQVRTERF